MSPISYHSYNTQAKLAADAWRSAVARAGGEKVLDDPKLLKRSLKKEVRFAFVCVHCALKQCVPCGIPHHVCKG